MPPVWLIEAGVYGEESRPLLAEIRRQGMAAEIVPHSALRKGSTVTVAGQPLEEGARVIGYGTFPFARQIQIHHRWVPGAWCTPENLDCATYYAHFGRYLLNQRYAMLPGVEAIRMRDWLYSVFAEDDEVFARPAGCHKLFTGRRISRESFADALSSTRFDPATLVVVAAPRPVGREWRLVVADGRITAASQYARDGQRAVSPGCPEEIVAFAENMLAAVGWRPDPVFMLDVCESDGDLRLVELNGFSCSWLYACDPGSVVSAVSQLAGGAAERPGR
jgi:hypothetical protein